MRVDSSVLGGPSQRRPVSSSCSAPMSGSMVIEPVSSASLVLSGRCRRD